MRGACLREGQKEAGATRAAGPPMPPENRREQKEQRGHGMDAFFLLLSSADLPEQALRYASPAHLPLQPL